MVGLALIETIGIVLLGALVVGWLLWEAWSGALTDRSAVRPQGVRHIPSAARPERRTHRAA